MTSSTRQLLSLLLGACLLMACTPVADSKGGDGDASLQPIQPTLEDGSVLIDPVLAGDGSVRSSEVETGLGMPCLGEGLERCSLAGAGARQICAAGVWTVGTPCASGQICQGTEGAVSCQTVAEVCKGSAGMSVCDNQGSLIVCNPDGTVKNQQQCPSLRLCLLGQTAGKCATCVPNTEFRCTGAALEVCAPDGQGFGLHETCATEALCNKVAGTCTTGVCAPNKVACSANMLTKCNADGSAFASQMPCGTGTCDEMGGDCNVCEPGHKRCEGDMVLTCDPTGQNYVPSACPAGGHCVGAGNCAACSMDAHCSAMTQGCKVGVCGPSNTCVAQNAPSSTTCTASNGRPGTCANGTCQCTPQCTGKQCGDDGCGGMCPSRCGVFQKCSNSQCVDCTANTDCSGSLDGCNVGMCSSGMCTTRPAASTTRCTTLSGSGMCSNGTCQVCVPSCATDSCGSDGCGGTCRCSSGKQCFSGSCKIPQWGLCNTVTFSSSECGGSNSAGYSCGTVAGGISSFCIPRASGSSCPSGLSAYNGLCLVSCSPPPIGSCSSPFGSCRSLADDGTTTLPGVCVR